MRPLDWLVMAAYGATILGIGAYFARRQRDAADYFLGQHDLPWWAVMLSIVATETSALTVISVPGIAARGDLTFLQLPFGYLLGRVGVALWLLPGYFTGRQETAYTRLETRFGAPTRRLASGVFLAIRALGDSVRVFATAIPLAIVTHWSLATSVLVVVCVTLAYTWGGGLKAVVWVDLLQLCIYLFGAIATLWAAAHLAGGFGAALVRASALHKLRVVDWHLSLTEPYTLLGGLIGGAMLSAASHGTDHLMVQRLLATRNLRDARRAIVGSGVVVIIQFAVFLLVGTLLWAAGADPGTGTGDAIYPRFMVDALPPGIAGLAVAGLVAAAMSTVSSSLNSLASASTHDFYAPLTGRREPQHLLRIGRWLTLGWAAVALAFGGNSQPVVVVALSIASITYGGLLGTYMMSAARRVRQRDVILAILVGTACMIVVVLIKPGPLSRLAWPWYVPVGTIVTLVVGWLSSMAGSGGRGHEPPGSGKREAGSVAGP
jgi:solute:Na+ symporter, SSS family